jgi:excisionase family DNA binding protein
MPTSRALPADDADLLLTVRQVATRLSVSTATVHRLIEARDLGHVRIGQRAIRVRRSAVADYLERRTVRGLR